MSKINFLLSLKSAPVISWVYINGDWYINEFNQKAKEFFGTEEEMCKLISKRKIRNTLNDVRTNKVSNKKITHVKGHTLKIIKDDENGEIFTLLEKAEADLNKLFGYIDESGIGIAIVKEKNNGHFNINYKNKQISSLVNDFEEELDKGLHSRTIDKNKKLTAHSCGNNYYLVTVERSKGITKELPLSSDIYKSIKLELNSIYAVLDLTEETECSKDIRESCDEISQTIDDYYYSTLIDRNDVNLDLTQLNIHDIIDCYDWKKININHQIQPLAKGDIKKIKYILSALYTSDSCIEIFNKKSPTSKIRKSSVINLENTYFRIKPAKELDSTSLRYKIIKYLCELMNGNIYDYGNEILFNIVLEFNRCNGTLGLLSNIFQNKNVLVWSESPNNWNKVNCVLSSLGIHAVHGSTKKRINSYIKTHKFDAIIIDKSISKPKGIKYAIYLINKPTTDTKGHVIIDINSFNIISAYNILRQYWKIKKVHEPSSDSETKKMKTHVIISDIKSKSLIDKQIKSLDQNCVDNPKDADIILIEILKGQKINIDPNLKKKVIVGINFGPQMNNRQKNKLYRSGVSLILNSPVTKHDLNVMYQALSQQ